MAGSLRPEELGRLFEAHGAALVLYARQWCERGAAEDVVQEAFVALASQREQPRQVVAWLHRVVRNRSISWGRKRRRRERHEGRAAQGEWEFREADAGISAEEATRLLESLGSEQREAVVARVWGGLSFEEVAGLLGCSVSSAHRWYHEGLARLHERMEGPCRTQSTNRGRS